MAVAVLVCKGLPKVNVPSRPLRPTMKASTDLDSAWVKGGNETSASHRAP